MSEGKAQCGTRSGYYLHRRHDEEPCDDCTRAARDYMREYNARRRDAAPAQIRNRLGARAQRIALRRLKDSHESEYHALYAAAKIEVGLSEPDDAPDCIHCHRRIAHEETTQRGRCEDCTYVHDREARG